MQQIKDTSLLTNYQDSCNSLMIRDFQHFHIFLKFKDFLAQFHQIQGSNMLKFETWIKVNYRYNTENFYNEN